MDEAVLRLQVENVELIDPGWNEEQRYRIGLLGERRVLNKLDKAVAVDDLTWRESEVLPGANASVSVMLSRPWRRSATRLRRPLATLPPQQGQVLKDLL